MIFLDRDYVTQICREGKEKKKVTERERDDKDREYERKRERESTTYIEGRIVRVIKEIYCLLVVVIATASKLTTLRLTVMAIR